MAHFPRPPSAGLQFDTAAYVLWAKHNEEEHDAYLKKVWGAIEKFEDVIKTYGTVEEIRDLKKETQRILDRTEAVCRKREDALEAREQAFPQEMERQQREFDHEKTTWVKDKQLKEHDLAERFQELERGEKHLSVALDEMAHRENEVEMKLAYIARKDAAAKAFLEVE